MSYHLNIFIIWIRRFISEAVIEILRIPESVFYAGEDPKLSLKIGTSFWISIINIKELWTEYSNKLFFDELMTYIREMSETLDISYTIKESSKLELPDTNMEVEFESEGVTQL